MRFKEFIKLEERLIMHQQGKRYGQIVFLAGGAGSGKGFVVSKFMEQDKFKVRDVDAWKSAFLDLSKTKNLYPELKNLDLRKPKDVFALHMFVKEKGIKEKSLDLILGNATNPETLPNIIFDITLKDLSDMSDTIPSLIAAGYKPENIHLTWVLANYHQAVSANANRARVVPDNILLATHEGAAKTMWSIIQSAKLPEHADGEVRIVLNNRENTKFYQNKNSKGDNVIADFTYLAIKKAGKPFMNKDEVLTKLRDWVLSNIPKSKETQDIHS